MWQEHGCLRRQAAVPTTAPELVPAVHDLRREQAERVLEARRLVERHGEAPAVALRIDAGEAAAALRTVAEEHDSAAVVVGTGGRGALLSGVLGSTSRGLGVDVPCPAVVCPAVEDDGADGGSAA